MHFTLYVFISFHPESMAATVSFPFLPCFLSWGCVCQKETPDRTNKSVGTRESLTYFAWNGTHTHAYTRNDGSYTHS